MYAFTITSICRHTTTKILQSFKTPNNDTDQTSNKTNFIGYKTSNLLLCDTADFTQMKVTKGVLIRIWNRAVQSNFWATKVARGSERVKGPLSTKKAYFGISKTNLDINTILLTPQLKYYRKGYSFAHTLSQITNSNNRCWCENKLLGNLVAFWWNVTYAIFINLLNGVKVHKF